MASISPPADYGCRCTASTTTRSGLPGVTVTTVTSSSSGSTATWVVSPSKRRARLLSVPRLRVRRRDSARWERCGTRPVAASHGDLDRVFASHADRSQEHFQSIVKLVPTPSR